MQILHAVHLKIYLNEKSRGPSEHDACTHGAFIPVYVSVMGESMMNVSMMYESMMCVDMLHVRPCICA